MGAVPASRHGSRRDDRGARNRAIEVREVIVDVGRVLERDASDEQVRVESKQDDVSALVERRCDAADLACEAEVNEAFLGERAARRGP